MGVCGKRGNFEFLRSPLERLLRTGERKRDEFPTARGHSGESGERQLWQRHRW